MKKYGIIADIHGNGIALDAVLTSLEQEGVDSIYCLGDIIGYSSDTNYCVNVIKEHNIQSILGNHEVIILDRLTDKRCCGKVKHSLKITRSDISSENLNYLRYLPEHIIIDNDVLLIHGGASFIDEYMLYSEDILKNNSIIAAKYKGIRICFYGHTHEKKVFGIRGDHIEESKGVDGLLLDEDTIYYVNPGSVDASRKEGFYQAQFAVLDRGKNWIHFKNVEYDTRKNELLAEERGYRMNRWQKAKYYAYEKLDYYTFRLGKIVSKNL